MTRAATPQSNDAATEFGALVRQYRLGARLTQESLAELAGLSTRGLQCLESGARHPYPATARRLAEALAVDSEQLERFFKAGRWRPGVPAADRRSRPRPGASGPLERDLSASW